MISKALNSLLAVAGRSGQTPAMVLIGSLLALIIPALAILAGGVVDRLVTAQSSPLQSSHRLGWFLPDPSRFSPDFSVLGQISVLLASALVLIFASSLLLLVFYRMVQRASVRFELALIEKLRAHAKALATVRTLSAQKMALEDCLNYHAPRVRASLSRWWRTFPRHFVQLVACILVAALIQPWLALLTLVATGLVVLAYRYLDGWQRAVLPVTRERAAQERETLIDLSIRGPLLESVHEVNEVEKRFAEQLIHYQRDAVSSLTRSAWKTPLLVAISGLLCCLFLFLVSVQVLRGEASFSPAGAFAFVVCFVGAFASAARIQKAVRDINSVETAAEELQTFLALAVEEFNQENLKSISRIAEQIEIEHATLQDSRGRKLIENVSVIIKPGQLIGLVASQAVQAQALAELLMGFGRPVSGRMLVDGTLLTDILPESLRRCAHWVAPDGALVTGSVRDNILESRDHRHDVDLLDITKAVHVSDTVQQLPDGLSTLITPGDDRLNGDDAFRIGLARANLSGASVIVIEEPVERFDHAAEQQSVSAMRSLVKHSTITVVLAERLETLRQCDQVIMLHEHKLADVGTHAQLIQHNELYRHMNYIKFNPFRSLAESQEG